MMKYCSCPYCGTYHKIDDPTLFEEIVDDIKHIPQKLSDVFPKVLATTLVRVKSKEAGLALGGVYLFDSSVENIDHIKKRVDKYINGLKVTCRNAKCGQVFLLN